MLSTSKSDQATKKKILNMVSNMITIATIARAELGQSLELRTPSGFLMSVTGTKALKTIFHCLPWQISREPGEKKSSQAQNWYSYGMLPLHTGSFIRCTRG